MLRRPRANFAITRTGAQRRGSILFEVMLSVALFVGAAAFTLAAVRNVANTLERSEAQQEAIDLARSKMAELEAGLITITSLRGEFEGDVGSRGAASADIDAGPAAARPRWRMEVNSMRSEFTGLTLVELTVLENLPPEAESHGANPMRFTLRQLVSLRDEPDQAPPEDDLLKGLKGGDS
jgi:hypothetical protein